MSKTCPITGKNTKMAGGYSNRVRATKFNPTGMKRRKANLQKKKIWNPDEKRWITMKITVKAMKTLDKKGFKAMMKDINC